ncbi:MAG TPA: hypothetical protein VI934_04255 [Candidatus Nanoarchaeia archaeon]|nr:hypothetical protein [Candidatus Nanoarchaeia archaeon]
MKVALITIDDAVGLQMNARAFNLLAQQIDDFRKEIAKDIVPRSLQVEHYLKQGNDVIPIRDLRRGVVFQLNRDYQPSLPRGVPLRLIFNAAIEEAAQELGYQRGVMKNGKFVPNNTPQGPAYWVKQS